VGGPSREALPYEEATVLETENSDVPGLRVLEVLFTVPVLDD
jgi:hypothetical protein